MMASTPPSQDGRASGPTRKPASLSRRILLVEDEPSLVLTLTDRLESEGYRVTHSPDGESALEQLIGHPFDLVMLDVMLPGMDGYEVLRELRRRGLETPVLMLTARGEVVDRVVGLKLGADDYLTKPFEMIELLARIEALFRRSRAAVSSASHIYSFGVVRVDFRRAEVLRDGAPVDLSALELKLLRYFIEHRGEVLSRDELLDKVWGYDAMPYTRTVDVHISSLRHKLEPQPSHPEFILTVHGLGYRFVG
jgi:two-component system alkaline phosphatase synthesis response regulator PhoP